MLKSMTGFGRHESQNGRFAQSWEVQSVNSRQLNLKWRLPPRLASKQNSWEGVVRGLAVRGKIEITLHVTAFRPEDLGVTLDTSAARAMIAQVRALAETESAPFTPDLNRLLNIPYLWQDAAKSLDSELSVFLETGLRTALNDWDQSRGNEGKSLVADIQNRVARMQSWTESLRDIAPKVKAQKIQLLQERVAQAMAQNNIALDENRLAQEFVLLADKVDVTEEIVRLQSHLGQINTVMAKPGDAGRRLDFLLQECFREINTCGNKIQDISASSVVVDFKVELEKCREQVQNLE